MERNVPISTALFSCPSPPFLSKFLFLYYNLSNPAESCHLDKQNSFFIGSSEMQLSCNKSIQFYWYYFRPPRHMHPYYSINHMKIANLKNNFNFYFINWNENCLVKLMNYIVIEFWYRMATKLLIKSS